MAPETPPVRRGLLASAAGHVRSAIRSRARALAAARRGPWRVAVTEASMRPAVEPGDWLLVDPTVARWPRPGAVVVFHEPNGGELALKRVAAGPGARVAFGDGFLHLAADEAWLLADADAAATAEAGFGPPVDSRRFGPVPLELLVGRAWFRYAPPGRIGRIPAQAGADDPGRRQGER